MKYAADLCVSVVCCSLVRAMYRALGQPDVIMFMLLVFRCDNSVILIYK